MYISFDEKDEKLIRKLAHEHYGGKKGAITDVLREAVHRMAEQDQEKQEREKSIKRLHDLMEKGLPGFSLNLNGKKLWENRGELYDR